MDVSYLLKDESYLTQYIESIDPNDNIDSFMAINIGSVLHNEQNKLLLDGLGIDYVLSKQLSCFLVNPSEISTLDIQETSMSLFKIIDILEYKEAKAQLFNKLKKHNNISHELIMKIFHRVIESDHQMMPILLDIIDNQLNEKKLIIDTIILYVYQNSLRYNNFDILMQLLKKYNDQELPMFKKEFIKNIDKHSVDTNQNVLTFLL